MDENSQVTDVERLESAKRPNTVNNLANMAAKTGHPIIAGGLKVANKLSGNKLENAANKTLNHGVKGAVARKALNTESNNRIGDALNKNKRFSLVNKPLSKKENSTNPNNPSIPSDNSETSDSSPTGGNLKFTARVPKFLLVSAIIGLALGLLVFPFMGVIMSSTFIVHKVYGFDNADSMSSSGSNSKLQEKVKDTNDLDDLEVKGDESIDTNEDNDVSYDFFIDNDFRDTKLEKLNYVEIAFIRVNKGKTTLDLDELADLYSSSPDNKMVYYFFLKMSNIYEAYNNTSKYKKPSVQEYPILDLPLLMATLTYNSEDMNLVFSSNLDDKEKSGSGRSKDDPLYAYENDWSDYEISRDVSTYDMQALAQHMVSRQKEIKCLDSKNKVVESTILKDDEIDNKSITCSDGQTYRETSIYYAFDNEKYKEYLKEFLNRKYFTGEDDSEDMVREAINEIYMMKEQYDDLAGKYEQIEVKNVRTSNSFWWPIGSEETTVDENGKIFAAGDPIYSVITSYFGSKDIAAHANGHGAIDISGSWQLGVVNVIAAKSGVVVYPINESQTHFVSHNDQFSKDGGSYGNHVIIQHNDGTYTLYGHLERETITVFAGETVEQGQVIGKVGSSGASTGAHLHFEMRVGANLYANRVDPLEYVDIDNPRPMSFSSSASSIPVTTTSFTKEEFVAKMNDYCERSGNEYFCRDWAPRAELIYDVSLNHEINPELVVATAGREQGWRNPGGSCNNNYYGMGVPNLGKCNTSYPSFEAGIIGYAELLAQYRVPGTEHYNMIVQRYNDREAAGCDPAGHGLPDDYAGILSIYGWIGNYRYNPGGSSRGGCYYLNHYMYEDDYCSKVPTCPPIYGDTYDNNTCPVESATTVCEQNDYTIYGLKETSKYRYDVFGI